MLGLAQQAGHELTSTAEDADVLVVNTCAFIDRAKQESIDTILEMAQQKRDGRCSRLVVTGCLAERYRDELRREIPEIDAVLGTGEVPQIVDALEARTEDRGPRIGNAEPLVFHRSHAPALEPRPSSLGTRTPSPPHLPLRRRHAAAADDPVAPVVHQGCRRLRLHVRVLHHPHTAGPVSQPYARLNRARGAGARGAWRPRAAAHFTRHDVLWHRPR